MEDQYYNVKRLGLILAKQAEIEGMKAANQKAKFVNSGCTYDYDDFQIKAWELEQLAHAHNEQL